METHRTRRYAALMLLASVPIAGHVDAIAQQGANSDVIDEIVTTATPIRDSQAAAIEAKRDADNVVDVISADLIGRFPDQNLADSLGRVPGIAIERDQGQARYINFRGAPFRYTTIAIDGVNVPGAENGRIPRFDSFPSVITSRVEVNKAITADLPGESVAGFVNIGTSDPFARRGLWGSFEGGLGEQVLGGGDVEKLNGRLAWSSDSFGAVVFASRNLREQVTDNREFDLAIDPASNELIVNELDYRSYFVDREDNAYGGRLEFRGDGALSRLFVSSLYNEFVDSEQRNQFVFDFAGGAEAVGGAVVPGNTGSQPLVLVSRLLEDGVYENSTFTNTLGADFIAGDWLIDTRINYTETKFETFLPIPFGAGGTVAADYDVTNVEDPVVRLFEPFTQTPTSLSDVDYAANLGISFSQNMEVESTQFKVDAERFIDLFGDETLLKAGAIYDDRDASGWGNSLDFGAGFPATVDVSQFDTGAPWFTDFSNTIGGTYYDNPALRRAWAAEIGGLAPTPSEDQIVVIDERILAAYAMITTDFSGGTFVLGLRVEQTDFETVGPSIDLVVDKDYTSVLPNAHVNFDLADDVKLRVSASTGISRPTYVEARASAIVDPTNDLVIGGNPNLDEETSVGADVSLEWYFANASLASAGVFYRSIDDVIYSSSTTVDGGTYFPAAAGEDWNLVGFVNGRDGYLAGLELSFVAQLDDGPLTGFGASANVTLLDSEFTTREGQKFQLPGTSDTIYNASLFYENFGLSARINYQYRDAWLTAIEDLSFGEFWDEQQRVDLSLRYQLPFEGMPMQLTVFANANNLTDEADVRYIGQVRTPNQIEGYGRRYVLGILADF